ncbi:uncharacterized protein LOC116298178 [Actinia tenebrosa]|uniref:Uncharacterized protein LOC116298178 n=1 Tax=Actinia tenebrosa TaxID=6105 RepID=A0A6P8I3J5_ACTTE|nr:uncharacterized protein LOC116298178 [Actinia tenebrosa]XP_031562418.1 uncharacterized protein LOC116298178 [Actinia tenebrosa]
MPKSEELKVQLNKAAKAFDDTNVYHEIQTKYTVESAELLLQQTGILSADNKILSKDDQPVTIVELGAGTGLFTTSALAALEGKGKVRYVATDPLECMEKACAKYLPDVEFALCKAENMPFPDSSVDAILGAGCFHWFANQDAYQEMYRILKPNGTLGYITNLPSETESPQWVLDTYKILYESYNKTKAPFEHDFKWRKALLNSNLFENFQENLKLRNFQAMNFNQCVQFFASFGGVASASEDHRSSFQTKLVNILDKHFKNKGEKLKGIEHIVEIYTAKSVKTQ